MACWPPAPEHDILAQRPNAGVQSGGFGRIERDIGFLSAATMEPTADLVRALFDEEVQRAREMSPADKLLEGPRLFDRACQLMEDGIRHRHPYADAERVRDLLLAQLAMLRKLEQGE